MITTGQCPLLSDHLLPTETVEKAVRLSILMHFHNYNLATYKFPSCHNGQIHQQGYNAPRQRNEAIAFHPSGHLNAKTECEKSDEIDEFFDWSVSFYIFVVSKTCPFTLSFVFSHFPIVWRRGGAHYTTNQFTMIYALGGDFIFWFYLDFGVALFFNIQFLFSKSVV